MQGAENRKAGVSVVICTYNGRDRIASAIESVFLQEQKEMLSWELIIIDNASKDDSFQYCEHLLAASPFASKTKLIREMRPGAAMARKRALYESEFDWVLFVDDDNQLEKDYLIKGWEILSQNPRIGALGGLASATFDNKPPSWFDKYAISFAVGPQASVSGKMKMLAGRKLYSAGCFFNKHVLLQYFDGDFDAIMTGPKGNDLTRGEDTEWCMMIELAGYSLWYSSELRFKHHMPDNRLTWEYLVKLKTGNASGAAKFQPYLAFYVSENPGSVTYWRIYLKEMIRLQILDLKYSIFGHSINNDKELGKSIIKAKARSYKKNIFSTYRHFIRLKKKVKAIREKMPDLHLTVSADITI